MTSGSCTYINTQNYLKYFSIFHLEPPEVIVPRSNVSKFSGESVKITCVSYGDPQPTNKWYKMSGTDKIIIATSPQSTGSSPRIIVENDMLTINQIVKGDEGNYVCEATNVAGQASKLVHLNVTGEFLNPLNCSISERLFFFFF